MSYRSVFVDVVDSAGTHDQEGRLSSTILSQHNSILNIIITMTTPQSLEKEYTMEEVASHNKVDDCWLVIGNDATGE